jgi:ferredoxin
MPFVIAEPCIGTKDRSCVDVCPPFANAIHPRPDDPGFAVQEMLFINPETCIDCGACVPACPVEAIFAADEKSRQRGGFKGVEVLPAKWAAYAATNADYFKIAPEKSPHAQLVEDVASGDREAALTKLLAAVGTQRAAEMINEEIGSTLNLAQFTGSPMVLMRLRPLVKSLEALGDPRGPMFAELCKRRRFPGW